MVSKVPLVKEVSYQEYLKHIDEITSDYFKQILIDDSCKTPEQVNEFINNHLEDYNNTDVHKYYKLMGLLSSEEIEAFEKKVTDLIIRN